MDSFRRDPGETSERGAKRPRLPAVFEAVKAGRFDELRRRPDAPAAPTSPEPAAEAAPAPAASPPPKRRGYSVKAWENRDDLELEA